MNCKGNRVSANKTSSNIPEQGSCSLQVVLPFLFAIPSFFFFFPYITTPPPPIFVFEASQLYLRHLYSSAFSQPIPPPSSDPRNKNKKQLEIALSGRDQETSLPYTTMSSQATAFLSHEPRGEDHSPYGATTFLKCRSFTY